MDMADGSVASGSMVEAAENERLILTWGWIDAPFDLPPGSTMVEITLESVPPDSTRLVLTHRDLPQTSRSIIEGAGSPVSAPFRRSPRGLASWRTPPSWR
jgi:uncharacterized protein YndB with AHSA1/START domain